MINNGTTSHTTPHSDCMRDQRVHEVSISLANELTVGSNHQGSSYEKCGTENGTKKLCLSQTAVVQQTGMILLPVRALTHEDIAILFIPEYANLYSFQENLKSWAMEDRTMMDYSIS